MPPVGFVALSINKTKKTMKKEIRIVKKGEDESNIDDWVSLSAEERMKELGRIRQEYNRQHYGTQQGFQRVYRIIKRSQS
jgi:hypothetical protein